MAREKQQTDWDELQKQLQDDDVPAEEQPKEKTARKAASKSETGSKKASKSKKLDERKKAGAAAKRKADGASKVVEALDSKTSLESLSAELVDGVVAAASRESKKTRVAEDVPKPKRRRRAKPATPEEEQKDAAIDGILAQIQQVARRKSVAESESVSNSEDFAALVPGEQPDGLVVEQPAAEPIVDAACVSVVAETPESVDSSAINSVDDETVVQTSPEEPSPRETISIETSFVDESAPLVLPETSAVSLNAALQATVEPVAEIVESESVEEPVEKSAKSSELEGISADFWDSSDTIELEWGANAKTEEVEDSAEVNVEEPDEVAASEVEAIEESVPARPERDEVVAEGAPVLDAFDEPQSIDLTNSEELAAFFATSASEENLGFAPRREKKQKSEKKAEETSKEAPAPESKAEEPRKREPKSKIKKEVVEPVESASEFEEVEVSRSRRGSRRRREESVESFDAEPAFEENEPPREERRSRSRKARRDYESEIEESDVREGRRSREEREEREEREPRSRRERASRRERNENRELTDVDESSAPREERAERTLPSWNDAISYVVKFNLGRRVNRGKNK